MFVGWTKYVRKPRAQVRAAKRKAGLISAQKLSATQLSERGRKGGLASAAKLLWRKGVLAKSVADYREELANPKMSVEEFDALPD